MKKIIKNRLFLVIVTALIFTSVGVFANSLLASQIDYKNEKSVSDALDDLYTDVTKYKTLTLTLTTDSYSTNRISNSYITINDLKTKYKYFKVTAPTISTGATPVDIQVRGYNSTLGSYDLTPDTTYLTADSSTIALTLKSDTDNSRARAIININFFND